MALGRILNFFNEHKEICWLEKIFACPKSTNKKIVATFAENHPMPEKARSVISKFALTLIDRSAHPR